MDLTPFVGMPVTLQFKEPFAVRLDDARMTSLACTLELYKETVVAVFECFENPKTGELHLCPANVTKPRGVTVFRQKIAFPTEVVELVMFDDNQPPEQQTSEV